MPIDKISDARSKVQMYLNAFRFNAHAVPIEDEKQAMQALIDAAKPTPTDDPRPADPVELAERIARALRKRGIRAQSTCLANIEIGAQTYSLRFPDFDHLGPVACADVIQAFEAKRAQEWAGDK